MLPAAVEKSAAWKQEDRVGRIDPLQFVNLRARWQLPYGGLDGECGWDRISGRGEVSPHGKDAEAAGVCCVADVELRGGGHRESPWLADPVRAAVR